VPSIQRPFVTGLVVVGDGVCLGVEEIELAGGTAEGGFGLGRGAHALIEAESPRVRREELFDHFPAFAFTTHAP
jgi:hypothetical protein